MRNLRWILWYFWESLPTLLAFPIDSSKPGGSSIGNFWSAQWESYWSGYLVGAIGLLTLVFTLVGCLCCRRQRRPKGFQDDAGTGKEFKDGSTIGTETTIERVPSSSLELEVPRILTSSREKIQFDEISCNYLETRSAIKPPSSSIYRENDDENDVSRDQACNEWYEGENFPREKLKYLREIGRGWFGKVVEGTTITEDTKMTKFEKSRGVVVRILTEGATTREKAWFLGESTPYLKLHHPNILELLGFCLEADPYLLLFESCPIGDLKHFLRTNRENGEALRKENLPMRIALNIADALEHMHENGFSHTDLSARNCLVAQDLTAKLGDYGIGVEKYPHDYYVVGDRALPIRWSAPESLQCTETTMETRAITPLANIWSYGLLLWEIASWGERPYDDLGDEQIIEMIFTNKNENSIRLLEKLIVKCDLPENFREALEATWKFIPTERSSLSDSKEILCGKRIDNFEKRWENLKPNVPNSVDKSASLQDLRGSVDSELWQANSTNEKNSLRANFRLGPEEPINCTSLRDNPCQMESGSETEEESWRGRVERGAYTEKVKQKSKSVADLMILVHIDSDSDVESSLGPQNVEKVGKKRLPPSGSDGDLRSAVIADEFDEALRKLRDPNVSNTSGAKTTKNVIDNIKTTDDIIENIKITQSIVDSSAISENIEKPKLLTLTNQGQTPILRLTFDMPEKANEHVQSEECKEIISKNVQEGTNIDKNAQTLSEPSRNEEHVLRLVSKGNPNLALLRYVPERTSTPVNSVNPSLASFDVLETRESVPSIRVPEANGVDMDLWSDALAHELEKKKPGYIENSKIFDESIDEKKNNLDDSLATVDKEDIRDRLLDSRSTTPKSLQNFSTLSSIAKDSVSGSLSAPDTPRRDYSDSSPIRKLKNLNLFGNESDSVGSSSAPETPFRGNYDVEQDVDSTCEDLERIIIKDSAPDTPQSRGNYSVGNGEEDLSSTGEELEPGILKRSSHEAEDEEDRKHLSTPDDERSSDSGFRDKESCEEEESPIPGSQVANIILSSKSSSVNAGNSSPLSASAEEEQMRILFELDTILDAEYYGHFRDSDKIDDSEMSLDNVKMSFGDSDDFAEKMRSISESHDSTESTEILKTVRPSSCDANFFDNFVDQKTTTNDESRIDYLNDDNSVDLLESTEADSVSEFLKIEENRSDSKKDDLLADSSSESPMKTDKISSTDSSGELARLNFDSSNSREKDETANSTLGVRSDTSKTESSPECSLGMIERNSSTSVSLGIRLDTSDSSSSSSKKDRQNFSSESAPKVRDEKELSSPTYDFHEEVERLPNSVLENTEESLEHKNLSENLNDVKKLKLDDEKYSMHVQEFVVIPERTEDTSMLESQESSNKNQTSEMDEETNKKSPMTSPIQGDQKILEKTKNAPVLESPEKLNKNESFETYEGTSSERFISIDTKPTENLSEARPLKLREARDAENLLNTTNSIALNLGIPTETEMSSVESPLKYYDEARNSRFENFPQDWSSVHQEDRDSPITFDKGDRRTLTPEIPNEVETFSIESPLKLDGETRDSSVSMEQRDGLNSDAEQWSSRENIDEINDNDDGEDSSTMSLRSDNSYVSFGLDEEFVTAIRNELREKLPRAQLPVVEALDPHDEKEAASINTETSVKTWSEDDDIAENQERSNVDISIRYNIYGTPLSPIMEERESAGTSESLISKEESADASIASRVSILSEDVLVVDTRTNRAIIVEASPNGNPENSQQDDDRDTTHGDFSDEENLEYPQSNLNRSLESKRISMGSGGAPLPSPEEESKWQQQFPLPLQMQDDLMSTSFGTDRDWDSQDDEEGVDEAEDPEDDEEENSSSSGEFVWKSYDESHGDLENVATRSPPNKPKREEREIDLDEEDEEGDEEDDEEEEEFTPSAWDATLAPHKSALRSPEKNFKTGDQKKSVCFKKQRYHCVYEYPKETPVFEGQSQSSTTWEPTSYADWEEMVDEPRLDSYPIEYVETNRTGDEEFYVSSSNRPFQFQSGEGKYVSQFFPGASTTLLQHETQHQMSTSSSSSPSIRDTDDSQASQDEVDRVDSGPAIQNNGNSRGLEVLDNQQQTQLGELRHTRDRLKLNLLSTSGLTKADGETKLESRGDDLLSVEKCLGIPLIVDIPKEKLEQSEETDNIEKSVKIIEKMNANILHFENIDDKEIVNPQEVGNPEACSSTDLEISINIVDNINKNLTHFEDSENKEIENLKQLKKTHDSPENRCNKIEEKNNEISIKSDNEIIESLLNAEQLSNDKFHVADENVKPDEKTDSKVDVVGQSSNFRSLNNLAVNEASKETREEEVNKVTHSNDDKRLKTDNRDIDTDVKTLEKSKNAGGDEGQRVETFKEDSENFGDQKQESFGSLETDETKASGVLNTPKLENPSSIDEKNEEFIKSEKVQASSQS